MSDFFCPECKEFSMNLSRHKCPPWWLIWQMDGESREEAQRIQAITSQSAVEKWAAEFDAYGDYTIVQGHEAEVWVEPESPDGRLSRKRWKVIGEPVPEYTAREVK